MWRNSIVFLFVFFAVYGSAQQVRPPDKVYGTLFRDVQMSRIFPDSKTFVDAVPKRDPAVIVQTYKEIKSKLNLRFSLPLFVENNFTLPDTTASGYTTREATIEEHIKALWGVLKRAAVADTCAQQRVWCMGSLVPLPNAYIVPGGRFREVYYWDSYFTMLGLRESGETEVIENMVANFAYLIKRFGHIPNGNRTYYISRSQPPFFSLMVDLSAHIKGPEVYQVYQLALQKEYNYWMDHTAGTKHVVSMPDGSVLNRYWDQLEIPRQESYYEDVKTGEKVSAMQRARLYKDLRSAAESGWDFSSRWFTDARTLTRIATTDYIPVDLNCLLYHLERTLSKSYAMSGKRDKELVYKQAAARRKKAIEKYCWSAKDQWYTDYNLRTHKTSRVLSLAGMYPFFLHVSDRTKMAAAVTVLQQQFVKPGGVVTTTNTTGQQWDAPNGWPPLQWITIQGLENYNQPALAQDIAARWVALNKRVFSATGKLMEKYNVVDASLTAGGGEYPSQDGFGWTNGVLLALMKKYGM